MNQTPRLVLLTLTLGLVAGCSTTPRQAPIVERTTGSSNKPRPAPVRSEEPRQDAKGTYTVRRGDTLLRIAFDHGQSYRDLVTWNNLSDPDDIKVGQVLRVAPERSSSTAVVTQPVPMPPDSRPAVPRKSLPRADKKAVSDDTAEAPRGERAGERAEVVAAAAAAERPAVVGKLLPEVCQAPRTHLQPRTGPED